MLGNFESRLRIGCSHPVRLSWPGVMSQVLAERQPACESDEVGGKLDGVSDGLHIYHLEKLHLNHVCAHEQRSHNQPSSRSGIGQGHRIEDARRLRGGRGAIRDIIAVIRVVAD